MPRPKPWLKMWIEWLHDPKMLGLTLAEQGVWWRLLTLAQECAADGYLIKGSGHPLTVDEIANCIHIQSLEDRSVLRSMISKMESQGSLHWNAEALVVTHFADRQSMIPSEMKEAVKERVKQYRERHRVTGSPLPPQTPLSNKHKETEGEQRESVTAENPLHVTEKSLQASPALVEITKLYEENIGQLPRGGVVIEDMIDFAENFRGEVKWIRLAFKEALGRSKRQWRYIRSILERWQEEGGPDGRAKEELERQERTSPTKPKAVLERRRPITYIPGGEDSNPGAED